MKAQLKDFTSEDKNEDGQKNRKNKTPQLSPDLMLKKTRNSIDVDVDPGLTAAWPSTTQQKSTRKQFFSNRIAGKKNNFTKYNKLLMQEVKPAS